MAGKLTLVSKVVRCLDDTCAEEVLPEAVDGYARRKWIVFIGKPLR
jgi:hypothetical protein